MSIEIPSGIGLDNLLVSPNVRMVGNPEVILRPNLRGVIWMTVGKSAYHQQSALAAG